MSWMSILAKTNENTRKTQKMSTRGGQFLHLACQGERLAPLSVTPLAGIRRVFKLLLRLNTIDEPAALPPTSRSRSSSARKRSVQLAGWAVRARWPGTERLLTRLQASLRSWWQRQTPVSNRLIDESTIITRASKTQHAKGTWNAVCSPQWNRLWKH